MLYLSNRLNRGITPLWTEEEGRKTENETCCCYQQFGDVSATDAAPPTFNRRLIIGNFFPEPSLPVCR